MRFLGSLRFYALSLFALSRCLAATDYFNDGGGGAGDSAHGNRVKISHTAVNESSFSGPLSSEANEMLKRALSVNILYIKNLFCRVTERHPRVKAADRKMALIKRLSFLVSAAVSLLDKRYRK
jgi:hypothetical protein